MIFSCSICYAAPSPSHFLIIFSTFQSQRNWQAPSVSTAPIHPLTSVTKMAKDGALPRSIFQTPTPYLCHLAIHFSLPSAHSSPINKVQGLSALSSFLQTYARQSFCTLSVEGRQVLWTPSTCDACHHIITFNRRHSWPSGSYLSDTDNSLLKVFGPCIGWWHVSNLGGHYSWNCDTIRNLWFLNHLHLLFSHSVPFYHEYLAETAPQNTHHNPHSKVVRKRLNSPADFPSREQFGLGCLQWIPQWVVWCASNWLLCCVLETCCIPLESDDVLT